MQFFLWKIGTELLIKRIAHTAEHLSIIAVKVDHSITLKIRKPRFINSSYTASVLIVEDISQGLPLVSYDYGLLHLVVKSTVSRIYSGIVILNFKHGLKYFLSFYM